MHNKLQRTTIIQNIGNNSYVLNICIPWYTSRPLNRNWPYCKRIWIIYSLSTGHYSYRVERSPYDDKSLVAKPMCNTISICSIDNKHKIFRDSDHHHMCPGFISENSFVMTMRQSCYVPLSVFRILSARLGAASCVEYQEIEIEAIAAVLWIPVPLHFPSNQRLFCK